jgi:hypothetical protein
MGKGRKILAKFIDILPSKLIKKVAVTAMSIDLRMPFAKTIAWQQVCHIAMLW